MKPQLSVVCKPDGWDTLPPEGLDKAVEKQEKWEKGGAAVLISQSQTGKLYSNKENSSLSIKH